MKIADMISKQDIIMMNILMWKPFKPRKELFFNVFQLVLLNIGNLEAWNFI